MDNKKIGYKKSANSLTALIISLIMIMGLFTGGFLWLSYNAQQSGVMVDSKYNDTFNKIEEARQGIDTVTTKMENSFSGISESSNGFIAAWNGMKGLASALQLPFQYIDSTRKVYEATIFDTDILPLWATTLVRMGIIAFVIFLLYAILKGEPGKM